MHTCFCYNAALPLYAEDIRILNQCHYRLWRIIGTELGIGEEVLKSIERDHTNYTDCLQAMIDSANPALTHEMITKVLQSERVSNAVKGQYNYIYDHYVCMHL